MVVVVTKIFVIACLLMSLFILIMNRDIFFKPRVRSVMGDLRLLDEKLRPGEIGLFPRGLFKHTKIICMRMKITISDILPSYIEVGLGTTISWANRDSKPHVVVVDGLFKTESIPPGKNSRFYALNKLGKFTIRLQNDKNFFRKEVIVVKEAKDEMPNYIFNLNY